MLFHASSGGDQNLVSLLKPNQANHISASNNETGRAYTVAGNTRVWYPVRVRYRISSRFGRRHRPTFGASRFHRGIDLACPRGTNVYAALSGRVIKAAYGKGYGYHIIIEHADGWKTLYAHLSQMYYRHGQYVRGGDQIGRVGATGTATGNHLHFELLKGWKRIDPERLLQF